MHCGEPDCTSPIKVKSRQMCSGHYMRWLKRNAIDNMHVEMCHGECGKRVHNARFVSVPGIPQGHGPGMHWCTACHLKYRPSTADNKYRGNCRACGNAMMIGELEPGYVQFWGKGMCKNDYYRDGEPALPRTGAYNNQAKLTDDDVREIRRLKDAGEPNADIARMFGIHRESVRRIGRRMTWTHI